MPYRKPHLLLPRQEDLDPTPRGTSHRRAKMKTSPRGRAESGRQDEIVTFGKLPHGEPLPKEGPEAFQGFCCYRDMDELSRSLRKVAETLGKSPSLIDRWSARNHWKTRVASSDLERDLNEAGKAEQAEKQVQEKQESERRAKEKRFSKS